VVLILLSATSGVSTEQSPSVNAASANGSQTKPKLSPTPNASTIPKTSGVSTAKNPGPSKSPMATLRAQVKSNRVGIATGDTLPWLSSGQLNAELNDFQSLGVGWVRLDIDWSDIQPNGPDRYDWSNLDNVVKAANARGLKLLPTIAYTAPWARLPECASSEFCQPQDPHQFATFAAAAVARYAPLGVHDWEVWNEENTVKFWQPSPNITAYVQLLQATYPLIKQADPASTVILGGLAPTSAPDGIDELDFLSGVYKAGARTYFDAVGVHPYSFPVPASYFVAWSAWSQMSATTPSIRSIMSSNGDGDKQVWATEYGAPTNGPGAIATETNYNLDQNPDHVDEAFQAYIAADAVNTAETYPWMGPLFWYSYKDLGTNTDAADNFYGLLRADGSRKPAYYSFQQAVSATH
jgi:hypothetical protein